MVEDMKNAYRQLPVLPAHACVAVVAYWNCELQQISYIVLRGLPFGLSSAVLNFNRVPVLGAAILRRMVALPASPFFDDAGGVDLAVARHSGQHAMQAIYSALAWRLDPDKSQPGGPQRVYLGMSADVGNVPTSGFMTVDLKPGIFHF